MKIGTKLWCATALIAACQLSLVAISGLRSASSTQFFDTHQAAHEAKLDAAMQWQAQRQAYVERLQALALAPAEAPQARRLHEALDTSHREIEALIARLEAATQSAPERSALQQAREHQTQLAQLSERITQLRTQGDMAALTRLLDHDISASVRRNQDVHRDLLAALSASAAQFKAEFKAQRQATIALAASAAVLVLSLLAAGTWWLVRSIRDPLREAVAAARRIAQGDLATPVHGRRDDEIGEMMQALAQMQQALRDTVAQVRLSTDSISTASSEIAQGNQDLSHR
ncbi:HAMP domain-containing protein, partial [Caldimonas sp.]